MISLGALPTTSGLALPYLYRFLLKWTLEMFNMPPSMFYQCWCQKRELKVPLSSTKAQGATEQPGIGPSSPLISLSPHTFWRTRASCYQILDPTPQLLRCEILVFILFISFLSRNGHSLTGSTLGFLLQKN